MTPEAADYLAKAHECLGAAKAVVAIPLPSVAAKEAYLAAYHAGEALIFERTGRAAKSHRGLRSRFAQLAKKVSRIDRGHTRFLGQAYKFKEVADYGIGPQAVVTVSEAQEAIDGAQRFLDWIRGLLP